MLGATAGPGGFARGAGVPLPYRAVIVDESSMVDLVLMDQLLAALPDGCDPAKHGGIFAEARDFVALIMR